MPRTLAPLSFESAELPSPPPRARAKWPWLVGWAVVVIAAIALSLYYFMPKTGSDPISLSVTERDGELQIGWNKTAKAVAGAAHGELTIVDGKDTRTVALTPADLGRGNFGYQRKSGDIEVRLKVESPVGQSSEEASKFLGRPVDRTSPDEMKALQQQRDDLQEQVDKLTRENESQAEHIQELERTLRILQARGR